MWVKIWSTFHYQFCQQILYPSTPPPWSCQASVGRPSTCQETRTEVRGDGAQPPKTQEIASGKRRTEGHVKGQEEEEKGDIWSTVGILQEPERQG